MTLPLYSWKKTGIGVGCKKLGMMQRDVERILLVG
jgi:hypothetical protein